MTEKELDLLERDWPTDEPIESLPDRAIVAMCRRVWSPALTEVLQAERERRNL